ncbi:MAG: hypothetical protein KME64_04015 [Scytonematopsis contorta HA4267-MV1]|jgi:hypothetical protein|nr:hypothetical protein [Scytonematopsis contorta HA4267-MV1]
MNYSKTDVLNSTYSKYCNGAILPSKELMYFDDWVVKSYALAVKETIEIQELEGIVFNVKRQIPINANLCTLRLNVNKETRFSHVDDKIAKRIPEKNMRRPMQLIGTQFILVPKGLNEYQETRICHYEALFKYVSAYIIREVWGKSLCDLPPIDNKIISEMKAYSEKWLKFYWICKECRDFMTEEMLHKFPRSWDLFNAIIDEYRQSLMSFWLSDKAKNPSSKEEIVQNVRQEFSMLKDCINPYCTETNPYTYKLIETCFRLSNLSEVFLNDFWTPYLKAGRQWAQMIESSPSITATYENQGKTARQRRGKRRTFYVL